MQETTQQLEVCNAYPLRGLVLFRVEFQQVRKIGFSERGVCCMRAKSTPQMYDFFDCLDKSSSQVFFSPSFRSNLGPEALGFLKPGGFSRPPPEPVQPCSGEADGPGTMRFIPCKKKGLSIVPFWNARLVSTLSTVHELPSHGRFECIRMPRRMHVPEGAVGLAR